MSDELDTIGFHWANQWTDRGLLVGGTRTGKSTLGEQLIYNALGNYQNLRVFIADTKPRFRAQWDITGVSANHYYSKWDHGTYVSDSYRVPLGGNLNDVWKYKGRIAIAQTNLEKENETEQVIEITRLMTQFFHQARASIPQLLYVDEVMDFFKQGGNAIGGPVILRVSRAGAERGIAELVATQRPRNIPVQVIEEANKIFLFNLRYEEDLGHLAEFGIPGGLESKMPTQRRIFYYYDHENPETAGKYKLNLES